MLNILHKLVTFDTSLFSSARTPMSLELFVKIVIEVTFKALVQKIWLTVLGSDDGDFFTLGGESLQAIKIISVLNAYCQLDLNLRDIFEHPSLTDFCHHLVHLAYSHYGLDQRHLDMRCAIGLCLSTEAAPSASSALFIQSSDSPDERHLLDALSFKQGTRILTSKEEVLLHVEWPLAAAVFNIPETLPQYEAWLDALPSLLHALSGRVQQMFFLHSATNGAKLTQDLLCCYRHKKLRLLLKADRRLQIVNAGIAELIAFSVQLGYFPHIRFDTANERLSGCVLKSLGLDDEESSDHYAAFAAVQQRNPGVQLCTLSRWLNLISANSRKLPNNLCIDEKNANTHKEGANS